MTHRRKVPRLAPRPRLIDAMAAVAIVLRRKRYSRNEILGAIEGLTGKPKDWWVIVIARTHDEEWMLYGCWPAKEGPRSKYDDVGRGMVVRNLTNGLSHGDALLSALGHAAGIL